MVKLSSLCGVVTMKYKVTDSEGVEHHYTNDDELLKMLNNQFDLMQFERVAEL